MAISASDLKFLASERMIDDLSTVAGVGGGGYASQAEVIDGTANNVFPDVMPSDRVAGMQQLREVYPIVLSADNDTLYNAAAGLSERPTDANVEVCMFTAPGNLSAQASAALGTQWDVDDSGPRSSSTNGSTTFPTADPLPLVGDLLQISQTAGAHYPAGGGGPFPIFARNFGLRVVTAVSGVDVTVDGSGVYGAYGLGVSIPVLSASNLTAGTRVSAVSHTTAGVSASATSVTVDKMWAAVHLPGASSLDAEGEPSGRSGMLPLYLPGDQLLIENGSTREAAIVSRANYVTGVITLAAGLGNAFASGSKVTRPVPLGGLQARANNVFSQQTWTRTWSDAAVGTSISSHYSGAIAMVNDGGVTDRWACVFTSATQYNLISERLGQIGAGDIGTDYLPLNPLTGQPYFTLAAARWGTGWLPGNALRFNTVAASAPVWLNRLVLPSAAGGTDQAALFMRGDANA